jgi:oligoendopeptidase F
MSHLGSYISCVASADARNEAYLQEEAALARWRAEVAKIRVQFLRGLKSVSDEIFASLVAHPALAGAQHYLNRLREEARRAMSTAEEVLAAELGVDGIQAWGRLYDTISSKLEFDMTFPDGKRQRVPMSQRRSLMEHRDRRVRKAAFEGGNDAWKNVADIPAAALNAIAGTRLTLNRHRRVDHFLEVALFQAAITRKTLDAMLEAVYANAEIARRILRLKAATLGAKTVAWYDLGAPLDAAAEDKLSWEAAKSTVAESFSRAYPALGHFFQQHVLGGQWVDWEPRPGKRPGPRG